MKKSLIIVLVLYVLLVVLAGCSKDTNISQDEVEVLTNKEQEIVSASGDEMDSLEISGDESLESSEISGDVSDDLNELDGVSRMVTQEENAIIETEKSDGITTVKTFNFSYDNKFEGVTVSKEFASVEEAKKHFNNLIDNPDFSEVCQNLRVEGTTVLYDIEGADDGTTKEDLFSILNVDE